MKTEQDANELPVLSLGLHCFLNPCKWTVVYRNRKIWVRISPRRRPKNIIMGGLKRGARGTGFHTLSSPTKLVTNLSNHKFAQRSINSLLVSCN